MRSASRLIVIAPLLFAACGGDDEPVAQREPTALESTAGTTTPATAAPDRDAGSDEGTSAAPATVASVPPSEPDQITSATDSSDGLFPDVVDASATFDAGSGTWAFSVTLSSPYDTPQRYADAWRVIAPDGTELGVRELLHDHANEQPFTRRLDGVAIPEGIDVVTVQGRDQINGYGGATVAVELVRS